MSRGNLLLFGGTLLALLGTGFLLGDFASWTLFGTLLAAFLTLAVFSFLVRDNPLYKLAEHIFIGVATGYVLAYSFWSVFVPNVWRQFQSLRLGTAAPEDRKWIWLLVIPVLLGLLFFARFVPKYAWLSRWSIAFLIGAYAGVNCTGYFQTDLINQASSTFHDFGRLHPGPNHGWVDILTVNVPILVGVLSTLTYFFFSKPHRGVVGVSARLGVFFLMVAFGASFGYTVMGRISLFIGRVQFLIQDWLAPLHILG